MNIAYHNILSLGAGLLFQLHFLEVSSCEKWVTTTHSVTYIIPIILFFQLCCNYYFVDPITKLIF